MDIAYSINDPNAISITRDQTVRVRAVAGLTVGCASGQLWVTQPGVLEDIFLPPGASYRCSGTGLIVINSCKPLSVMRLRIDPGGDGAGRLFIDSPGRLRLSARAAQALWLARIFG